MCTSHRPTEGADSAPIPNHFTIDVDGTPMASGPGEQSDAEAMRATYQDINPSANVAIHYRRCDDDPSGPCPAHQQPKHVDTFYAEQARVLADRLRQ